MAGRAAAAPVLDHLLDPVRPRLPVQPPALLPLPGPPPAHASRSQLSLYLSVLISRVQTIAAVFCKLSVAVNPFVYGLM